MVLFSIVLTAFLVILLEKTKLSALYALVLSPRRHKAGKKIVSRPGKIGKKKTAVAPGILGLFGALRPKKKSHH